MRSGRYDLCSSSSTEASGHTCQCSGSLGSRREHTRVLKVKKQQKQALKRENKKEHMEETSRIPPGGFQGPKSASGQFSAVGPGLGVVTGRLTWRTLLP